MMHTPSVNARLLSAFQVIHWRNLPVMIILIGGAFIMIAPFLWMFATSMRPPNEAYQLPPSFLPTRLNFDAYRDVLNTPIPFLRMYLNSFIVASVSTLGIIITASMAAFAFLAFAISSQ